MTVVTNKDEILDNVEAFLEELESENQSNIDKAIQLIKTSNVFLAILTDEVNLFIPSLFLNVQNQTFEQFNTKLKEDDIIENISSILGSTPKIDKTMDELFLDFCDEIEINRNDVGLSKEYWIVKDL